MKSPGSDFGNDMAERMSERMGSKMAKAGRTPFVDGSSAPSAQKGQKTPFQDPQGLVSDASPAKAPKARLKPTYQGKVPHAPGGHKPKSI